VAIQTSTSGQNARVPVGRLFVKVFLWFWVTVLALFAIGAKIDPEHYCCQA
jgi:hypothetical protein